MKSVMSHNFAQVPRAEIPRSSFDRSSGLKTTFDASYLIPIFVDEVLPGDTFNLSTYGFLRLGTPLYPIMDNIYLDTFYFFVPLRLIWDNFKKMMGEQDNPGDSTDYSCPKVTPTVTEQDLWDYMGLPLGASPEVNAFFSRAYNLIWNEWFRDQNLQNSVVVDKDDGPDTPGDYVLLKRGKRHDYFTSALPWPQKGTAVDIPLGTSAPIHAPGAAGTNPSVYSDGSSDWKLLDSDAANVDISATTGLESLGLYANLTGATGATINQLREAFQVQRMYEKDARGGTRYTELVRSHFGVTSPDARLQRPEYLGGGSSLINVTPVANTSPSIGGPENTKIGDLGAFATTSIDGHGFTKSFTEHGVIIGLANVRADLTYQNGINRMWSRDDRLDFFWPSLAHLGEQAILNKELYYQGLAADDDAWGYQERYAEYRYKPSQITGLFRSDAATSLDPWHLSQDFATLPGLNSSFIEEDVPLDRVVITSTEPHFIGDFYFKLTCARPMPLFGVPGMLDHF